MFQNYHQLSQKKEAVETYFLVLLEKPLRYNSGSHVDVDITLTIISLPTCSRIGVSIVLIKSINAHDPYLSYSAELGFSFKIVF